MKTQIKVLTEMSYVKGDIPKAFRVAFDLEKAFSYLINGKMPGLKGISGSGEVEFLWFGVARDAMLVMDGKAVENANKVTRIMYNNPHYLVSNDMEALYRLWDKRRDDIGKRGLLHNLLDYIRAFTDSKSPLRHDMNYYGYANMSYDWAKTIGKVKDVWDLVRKIKNLTEKDFAKKTGMEKQGGYGLSEKDYYNLVWAALTRIGETYKSEAEWIIKSDNLIIPAGSQLHVMYPSLSKEKMELALWMKKNRMEEIDVQKARAAGFETGLTIWATLNRYDIKEFVKKEPMVEKLKSRYKIIKRDRKEFEALKTKYFEKRYK